MQEVRWKGGRRMIVVRRWIRSGDGVDGRREKLGFWISIIGF